MSSIVLATHNPGKVIEISDLLKKFDLKIYSAKYFSIKEPVENGKTFIENAIIKSSYVSKKTNLPALADDSGLCVPILDNQPGIFSARWAGKEKNFLKAVDKIEKKMKSISTMTKKDRKAFFCCALSLSIPNGKVYTFEGKVHGHLQFPPRGNNGFGYDPIFIPLNFKKTFGEMKYKFKEGISHRKKAFIKLEKYLGQI